MRRRRLWCVMLISGLSALMVTTTARPAIERALDTAPPPPPQWEHVNRTCRTWTRDCNDAVNYEQLRYIQSNMNLSADPCFSFYNYSCGNWRHQHPDSTTMMMKGNDLLTAYFLKLFESWLRERELGEQKGISELKARRSLAERNELLDKKELAEIRDVSNVGSEFTMETPTTTSSTVPKGNTWEWQPHADVVLQKLLGYYRTCKAQNTIGQPNLRQYYEASKTSVNWTLSDYNWIETLGGIGQFGYSAHFLSMNVVHKNISVHRIVICPHEVDAPLNLTSDIYEVLSDLTNRTQESLQESFNALEEDLEKLSCQYCKNTGHNAEEIEECDCYKSDPLTFGELIAQVPEIDWQRYLSLQLGRQIDATDVVEIANLELIRLQLAYVRQIDTELNLLYTLARFLNYIHDQRLYLVKHSTVELSCIHHMRKVFNMPMNYLYERAYFRSRRSDSQRIVEEVFEELKLQFEQMINQNHMGFSSDIQHKLHSKLKHITLNVGNLPKNVSNQFYYDFMDGYDFVDEFTINHLHALKVFYRKYNALIDESENEVQHIWHSFDLHQPIYPDSLDASPYYNARTNLIVVTYAYLQLPFYDANFWPALIYGDLASTLGHELVHAFDTEFLKFDENGNPNDQPLASMFLNENFQRNFHCLQEGTVFERERMADVSGARLALQTFLNLDRNALDRNGQLYFLQFSQFFCGNNQLIDPEPNHDLDSARLDYVLSVLPEFSRVYNCPLGSRMNPYTKCEMFT